MPQCIGQALRRLVLQLTSYTAAPLFPVPRAPSQLIILHRTQIRRGQRAPRLSLVQDTGRLFLGRRLYSSVVERQSCKLKVLGSIPSGGFVFVRFFSFLHRRQSPEGVLERWNASRAALGMSLGLVSMANEEREPASPNHFLFNSCHF